MGLTPEAAKEWQVALLAEGVDRNKMRRTWLVDSFVALLAEGVDRNLGFASVCCVK